MIRAETAIVWTAVLHGSIPVQWHFRWLDEDLTAAAVVINIIGHQDTLETMVRAPLQHVDTVILKDDLGVDPAETRSAQRDSGVVEEVGKHGSNQDEPGNQAEHEAPEGDPTTHTVMVRRVHGLIKSA